MRYMGYVELHGLHWLGTWTGLGQEDAPLDEDEEDEDEDRLWRFSFFMYFLSNRFIILLSFFLLILGLLGDLAAWALLLRFAAFWFAATCGPAQVQDKKGNMRRSGHGPGVCLMAKPML